MLFQYISSLQDARGGVSAHTFTGRQEIVVRKMQPDVVKELVTEADFVISVDTFIQLMCVTYGKPTQSSATQMNDLLAARGNLLSVCGRYLLRVGALLEQAVKKATARQATLNPEERIRILDTDSPGKFNKIEAVFRTDLVKQDLYTEDTLPEAMYPEVVDATQTRQGDHGHYAASAERRPNRTIQPDAPICAPAGPLVLADGQALTEAHVLNRLGVKAYGDEVLVLWIDAPERATGVKAEPVDTISGVAEALDGSQPSQGTWCKVELMSLCLPDAVVDLVTKVPQPDSAGSQQPDSVFRLTRTVPADGLRPVPVNKEQRQTVILHPSLRDPGTTLGPYSFDDAALFCERAAAAHMILWAHACGIKSVEGVTVSIISDPGKLPFILQVRANIPFKKGTLLLAPAHGELLRKDSDAGREFVQRHGPNQSQVVHPAMLSHVELDVMTGSNDLRVKGIHDGKKSKWLLYSPLLAGKNKNNREDCLENIAPFWSLLNCSGPAVIHNMELESMSFKDMGFDSRVPAFPKMQKGAVFTVELPIARNISHISKGDILCLPFV